MSERPGPQINVSKIVSGGGIAGALFAVISTTIFLIGIPALRYFLPGAAVLGFLVALAIRSKRHETPGTPWILATTQKAQVRASDTPSDASSRRTLIPLANPS